MRIQVVITVMTGGIILIRILNSQINKVCEEWITLEILWTIAPGFILIWLGIPRLTLLYQQESLHFQAEVVAKVIGHQWYWEYNLPEMDVSFDSITTKITDFFPLADRDERFILPFWKNILFLVRRTDVIHSFTLPGLGIKADANPGRLNSINSLRKIPGWYVGQCRELCGSLHSNIAIRVEFTSPLLFLQWALACQE